MIENLVDKLRSTKLSLPPENATNIQSAEVCEAAASALANLLSMHPLNARRLIAAEGVGVLLGLLSSNYSIDLLDTDKATLVQANVCNALANTFCAMNENNILSTVAQESTASTFVMLCASCLATARRAACLVLGNLACNSRLRCELGRLGAIEAIWSISCKRHSKSECTTALWALSNLVWSNRANQTRCGYFFEDAFALIAACRDFSCRHETPPVCLMTCASAINLIANAIHFHNLNCKRLGVIYGGVETLISLSKAGQPQSVREPAIRCLACLTATDTGAQRVALAKTSDDVYRILVFTASDESLGGKNSIIRYYSACALANMCSVIDARMRL